MPCHTLDAIRDHYEFVFNMHISDASLATEELVVLQASGGLHVNCVKGEQCKALTLGNKYVYFTNRPYYVAYYYM